MTARQRYAEELAALADEEVPTYLTKRSGLPGPRANLELLAAFGDVAPASLVVRLADDVDEYLRCCGTAALGRLWLEAPDEPAAHGPDEPAAGLGPDEPAAGLGPDEPAAGLGPDEPAAGLGPDEPAAGLGPDEPAAGLGPDEPAAARLSGGSVRAMWSGAAVRQRLEATLTDRARDASWRVREGAAMAGQRIGAASPEGLAGLVGRWLDTGEPLVARAAIAAVCEPPILRPSPLLRAAALDACARATDLLRAIPAGRRHDPDVRTLRQGLAYCWSVAVAGSPEDGLPRFLSLATDDPDVAWLVAQNRTKARLAKLL